MPVPFKTPCRLTTLLCPKGEARPVWEVNNENEYEALLKEKQGSLYEMVGEGKPVNAYLDCDILLSYDEYYSLVGPDGVERYFINSNVTDKYGIATIRKIINDIPMFKNKTRFEMFREPRMVKDKCKFSYRFVIDIPFKSNKHIKRYLESLNFKNNEPFDLSVYNDGRIMNSVHSTKDFLCSLPLKPAEFQKTLPVENFLITCVNPDHPVVAIEEPTKIETVKSIKKYIDEEAEDVNILTKKVNALTGCINADCPYSEWLEILMAIKSVLGDTDESYDIADVWSATGASYDSRVFGRTWNSIKDLDKYTIGTLIYRAKNENPEKFKTDFTNIFKMKLDFDEIKKIKDYSKIKQIFETRVCKINDTIRFIYKCDMDGIQIKTRKELKETYENVIYEIKDDKGKISEKCFIDKWLKDPKMREYGSAINLPPPLIVPANTLNLWTPYKLALNNYGDINDGEIETINKHMFLLCGKSEECADHMIKTLAYKLQFPAYKTRMMTIFVGEEGTGKNIFYDILKKIFGDDKCFSTPNVGRKIFGDFAHVWADKQIVVLNDFNPGEVKKENSEKLKDYITETDITLEKKNVNEFEGKQYAHFIAFSQSYTPVANNSGSRRFFQMECARDMIGNQEYFTNLVAWMNVKENIWSWFKYLMNMDLTDFNPTMFPITEVSEMTKMANASHIEAFIEDRKEQIIRGITYKKLGTKGDKLNAKQGDEGAFMTLNHRKLFESFKSWSCGNVPDYQTYTMRKFQLEMYRLRIRLGLEYEGDVKHPARSFWKIIHNDKWVCEDIDEEEDT